MKKVGIIVAAGGSGTRMSASVVKQFALIVGRPVLARSIDAFRCVARFADIVVALPRDRVQEWENLKAEHHVPRHKVCVGGETRFESVRRALGKLDADCEYIAVHDAARPLVSGELILRGLDTARRHGSAIPVTPLVDSVRRITESGASRPEDRSVLRCVQTPQIFRADILRTAYERALGGDFTDDASVVESVGYTVSLVEGERRNVKITTPEDLLIASALIEA